MNEASETPLGAKRGIASINPASGEVMRRFEAASKKEVETKLDLAIYAFRKYRNTRFSERAGWLYRAAEILEAGKKNFARTMTLEMGKPIRAAVQEVEKCASGCRFYAENAQRFLADEPVDTNYSCSFVRYQPLGVVLAVMPWNFPFWQVFRFAAPALMAGNTGLLKHASNVPQCALAIEEILRQAGFPHGVFQTLLVGSDRVPELIEDARISAVTLTGSVGAGSGVAAAAGKAIKKTVLELGGSDPFIVMSSADLQHALDVAVQARTINNGQSCIAAKRFIVEDQIAEIFERGFIERMAALKVGEPLDETVAIGPLATGEVLETLEQQVLESVNMGANLRLGGKRLKGPGFFYPPTVLTNIPPTSPAGIGELFGPVASLFHAADLEDAIRIANDTPFGLGSSFWSKDTSEQQTFIDRIEAGAAFINGMVASDPRLPFGGVKQSGYGRELSFHGLREFVNVKTVVINQSAQPSSGTE